MHAYGHSSQEWFWANTYTEIEEDVISMSGNLVIFSDSGLRVHEREMTAF